MFSCFFLLSRKHRRVALVLSFLLILFAVHQLLKDPESSLGEPDQNGARTGKWTIDKEPCNALYIRQKLCQEYFSKKIGGNLCEDLCVKESISLEPLCRTNKETTFILFGRWNEKDIVLKRKKSSHSYNDLDTELGYGVQGIGFNQDPGQYKQAFTYLIHNHILGELFLEHLRNKISPAEILHQMYYPYSEKYISLIEMKSLWVLLQQEEYIKLQLLQQSKHFPKMYGFCGQYYVMERVASLEDLISIVKLPLSWSKRVKIALDLLDMVTEFKSTLIGSLSHCDIQAQNFGLAKDLRVVALDVDTVFTEVQMDSYMSQGNCSSNSDCSFFDCKSACASGHCTNKILTNNLHVICRDLFDSGWTQLGLLGTISSKTFVENQLKMQLAQCAKETDLPWLPEHEDELHKKMFHLLSEVQNSKSNSF